MKKVYICSPYRNTDRAKQNRNTEYAKELTKLAINAGLAPITTHLYMTKCLNEDKPEERAAGIEAGLVLLQSCDFVILGVRYGISEGMSREIRTAKLLGIALVNADKLQHYVKHKADRIEASAWDYAKACFCNFCKGSCLRSCAGNGCRQPHKRAYDYAAAHKELL